MNFIQSSCESNEIHEGAAVWLLQYLLCDPSKASLTALLGRPNDRHKKGVKLMTYFPVISNPLRAYSTNDIMAEAEAERTICVQTYRLTETQCKDFIAEGA